MLQFFHILIFWWKCWVPTIESSVKRIWIEDRNEHILLPNNILWQGKSTALILGYGQVSTNIFDLQIFVLGLNIQFWKLHLIDFFTLLSCFESEWNSNLVGILIFFRREYSILML